jgi:hypothetical protein
VASICLEDMGTTGTSVKTGQSVSEHEERALPRGLRDQAPRYFVSEVNTE